jgi:hypothetical protein
MEPMEQMEQYMMYIHLQDLVRLPWLPLDLWMHWLLVVVALVRTAQEVKEVAVAVQEVTYQLLIHIYR